MAISIQYQDELGPKTIEVQLWTVSIEGEHLFVPTDSDNPNPTLYQQDLLQNSQVVGRCLFCRLDREPTAFSPVPSNRRLAESSFFIPAQFLISYFQDQIIQIVMVFQSPSSTFI